MSHLCFLTPLHWADWLPWLPSPDIPVGPLSALGWRRLLRRGVSLPSSSSQDWLATERKPLTESSDSDSARWGQGADARSCQTHSRSHVQVRVAGSESCSLNNMLSANKHLCLSSSPTFPALLPTKPHLRIVFQWEATQRLHFNIVRSVLPRCYSSPNQQHYRYCYMHIRKGE